jgi:DNA primase
VLELCLDADRAGQDAMLRAERLARGSELELRVVPLPDNTDPAELVEREGGDALRARVESSMPFVVFHVDRILDRADISSAEGRDRAALELAPVLELPASALREDLRQRVASRLQLSPGQLAALIAQGRQAANGTAPAADETQPVKTINPAVRTERAFLVLCVALPEAGRRALAAIDPEQHLTSAWLRRVARHLAGQIEMPLNGLPADDEELAKSVADLVARAGRAGLVTEDHIEQQRLLLELARLDRAIRHARGEGGGEIHVLAHERETVLEAIRQIDARLEKAV